MGPSLSAQWRGRDEPGSSSISRGAAARLAARAYGIGHRRYHALASRTSCANCCGLPLAADPCAEPLGYPALGRWAEPGASRVEEAALESLGRDRDKRVE